MQRLLAPREAANILGISYHTLKKWISKKEIKTTKTPGGHHRIPESEIGRFIPKRLEREGLSVEGSNFRKISGRNQLICVIVALKFDGLLAQVTLAFRKQRIASIITADAARDLQLKVGERVAVLFKSTEVMILRV